MEWERETTFGFTCWLIWKNRNMMVFEGKDEGLHSIGFNASLKMKEYSRALKNVQNQEQSTNKRKVYIGWEAPEQGWVKINTDGSVKDQKSAACGGICRDENGR